ncbi:MAG: EamA/RhaT family transporter, partial [Pseudomonadota bacterium]
MSTQDAGELGPAIRAMVLAMLLISIIDNYVVVIAEEFGLWQFQFTRSLMAIPFVLIAARVAGETLRPKNLGRVVVRSAVVSIGLMIYFGTLAFLPIAQAIAG